MAINKYEVAQELSKSVVVSDKSISNKGAITQASLKGASKMAVTEVTLVLDNSEGGSVVNYNVIGDSAGLVSAVLGARTVADSGPVSPAIINTMTENGIAIQGFNYEAESSSTQLANAPTLEFADIMGNSGAKKLPLNGAKRNDQQNTKLLTIELDEVLVIDRSSRLALSVNAGETVTITLFITGIVI